MTVAYTGSTKIQPNALGPAPPAVVGAGNGCLSVAAAEFLRPRVARLAFVSADDQGRTWEFVTAPPRIAPGVASMVGYRALRAPGEMHRGMPSSTLTFIVSLDDGVEA